MNQENGKGSEENPENNAIGGDFPVVPQAPERQELETPESNQEADHPSRQEKISVWSRAKNWLHRKSNEANLTDWLMAFFTLVLAITTIVFTVYAKKQWREMHDAGTQTDRIIAADERLAKAMEDSVKQAKGALDATIEQNRFDQRAWLNFEDPVFTNGYFSVLAKNTGKTPAINTAVRFQIRNVLKGQHIVFKYDPTTTETSHTVIAPNGSRAISAWEGGLSAEEVRRIQSGEKRVYFYAEVTYDDIFAQHHWVTFCTYLVFQSSNVTSMTYCSEYNNTDQNQH